jgi:hypothetical protein
MTINHPPAGRRGSPVRRLRITGVVVLCATVITACTPHTVGAKHPCPDLAVRRAVALAKIGLTPVRLKEQQHCR